MPHVAECGLLRDSSRQEAEVPPDKRPDPPPDPEPHLLLESSPGRLRSAWSVLLGERLVPLQLQFEWLEYQQIFDDLLKRFSAQLARQAKAEKTRVKRLLDPSDQPIKREPPQPPPLDPKSAVRSRVAQFVGGGQDAPTPAPSTRIANGSVVRRPRPVRPIATRPPVRLAPVATVAPPPVRTSPAPRPRADIRPTIAPPAPRPKPPAAVIARPAPPGGEKKPMSLEIKAARAATQGGPGPALSGDPGLLGFLGGGLKRLAGGAVGLLTGGPAGAVAGLLGSGRTSAPRVPAASVGLQQRYPVNVPRPGMVGMGQRLIPGGETGMGIGCPTGYHANKTDYFLRDGTFVAAGSRCVKNRRRNPMNPRALSRSIGRVDAGKRLQHRLAQIETGKYTKAGNKKSCN